MFRIKHSSKFKIMICHNISNNSGCPLRTPLCFMYLHNASHSRILSPCLGPSLWGPSLCSVLDGDRAVIVLIL